VEIKALIDELAKIYERISRTAPTEPEDIAIEIEDRLSLLARSAVLLSHAEYFLNRKRGEVSEKIAKKPKTAQPTPTMLKEILNNGTIDEQRVYTQAERLNATITHQLDGLRTDLSYKKQTAVNVDTLRNVLSRELQPLVKKIAENTISQMIKFYEK
jgi:methyl coenzyme M reductase subunit C-like uncharacterized protein (methanogenesis marker protein 7)